MSTRSNIAIEDPKTKKVKVIYVHSDGYPYGVGKCLVDNYNNRELAKLLFEHGDASYLGDTIDECSFYGRDWNRDEEPAKTFNNEAHYMRYMDGEFMIEYIYLFKDNQWNVATSKSIKTKDGFNDAQFYFSKLEPVIMNKEYIKYKDKHEKHAEVKMISQIGKLLSENFGADQVMVQGADTKKKSN